MLPWEAASWSDSGSGKRVARACAEMTRNRFPRSSTERPGADSGQWSGPACPARATRRATHRSWSDRPRWRWARRNSGPPAPVGAVANASLGARGTPPMPHGQGVSIFVRTADPQCRQMIPARLQKPDPRCRRRAWSHDVRTSPRPETITPATSCSRLCRKTLPHSRHNGKRDECPAEPPASRRKSSPSGTGLGPPGPHGETTRPSDRSSVVAWSSMWLRTLCLPRSCVCRGTGRSPHPGTRPAWRDEKAQLRLGTRLPSGEVIFGVAVGSCAHRGSAPTGGVGAEPPHRGVWGVAPPGQHGETRRPSSAWAHVSHREK